MPLPEFNTGFKIIGEMTRDELVTEILDSQRERLNPWNMEQLRELVVNMRLQAYKHKLMNEAGIEPSMLGIIQFPEE